MKSLNDIQVIVGWYKDIPKGFNDVDTLIYSRRKLATHLFEVADYLGGLKDAYNSSYFVRKSSQASIKVSYIGNGESATSAAILADKDTYQNQFDEHKAEGLHLKIKLLYESGKDILQSMVQDIAYLRHEKANSND